MHVKAVHCAALPAAQGMHTALETCGYVAQQAAFLPRILCVCVCVCVRVSACRCSRVASHASANTGCPIAEFPTCFGTLLPQKEGVREAVARDYFQQLVMAVDYCHCLGIALCDIKVRAAGRTQHTKTRR